ncbi:MAG: hypothetical protein BMS9Abin19_0182 [Gammaproteobacteria bacterium]|nr:MAG: hypothetical protein BMS9Abin19_0182 [Gammaproteobacteria bacterium]
MNNSALPNKLLFNIGSYACIQVLFQWDGKQLIYQVNRHGGAPDNDEQKIIIPEESEWQRFWGAVRNSDVWYWREKCDPEICVCDGIEWKLELVHNGRSIKSQGSSCYPPNGADIPSESFKQLLCAFGELVKDQVFIREWYDESWE